MPKQRKLCLDWQPHKAELQNLYLVQDLPLERVMRHMEETHGFRATKAQYEIQLKKWDFRKNLSNEEWNYTLLQVRKRKFDGKESDVYLNGRVVPEKRIKKEMSRHFTLTQEQLRDMVSIPSTPEAITVSTPHATVPTAADNIILRNLPYFQFQALLESTGLFPMSQAQSPRIGATRQIALDSLVINLPSFTGMDSDEWDTLALFQEIASTLPSTFNEGGKMLLDRFFGQKLQADGNGTLSQIWPRMRVSSLERYDGELLEKSQLLCGPSRQSSVLRILEFALYHISNNLLSADATDEFTQWLIKQQQNGLLTSFLKTKIPTVHACATKILESALRIGDANFLELLIDSGIDISPLKGVCGGQHLVYAANKGNMQIVQILFKNGADVNIPASENGALSALQAATSKGYIHIVQVLLKAGANVDAVSRGLFCNTALCEAVSIENIELIRILLTAGANIDNCVIDGKRAIEYSALNKDDDEIHQILLSASSKDYSSITFQRVIEAASSGSQALSSYLAEKGKTGDLVQEAVLEKALIYECDNSSHDKVISLLDLGVNPNCLLPDNIGRPLLTAVLWGDFELFKILLQAGADVNSQGLLNAAMEHDLRVPNNMKMVQFLFDEGANFRIHGEAELFLAARKGNFMIAELLVSFGVDVNAETYDNKSLSDDNESLIDDNEWLIDDHKWLNGNTVLQNAVSSKNIELVKFLLDAGADVNAMNNRQTALQMAIRNVMSFGPQRLAMVQVLLAAGADVNIPEELRIGASILQLAIAKCDYELVSILLKEGADVNSLPREGFRSPVQEATATGNLSFVKLLLESGADINAPAGDFYGRTALQEASSSELPTMELIDFLLDAGADMNAPAGVEGGLTALQGAAIRGHMKIALRFLEAGADVNADRALWYGRTALEGAAEHGRLDMVQMLLNAGACGDSTKSHRFKMAIERARENGHFAIVSLLERA